VVNTAFMMGGALGLAVLASGAAARTASLEAGGIAAVDALNQGYQLAFLLGAAFAALAGGLGAACMRAGRLAASSSSSQPEGEPA
jgi:hypothetical protein